MLGIDERAVRKYLGKPIKVRMKRKTRDITVLGTARKIRSCRHGWDFLLEFHDDTYGWFRVCSLSDERGKPLSPVFPDPNEYRIYT